MRFAVASRNGTTGSGHIGQCADQIGFEVEADTTKMGPAEVERVALPNTLVCHHYKHDRPHPLGNCEAVIGASAGDSFVHKLVKHGIEAVLTAESDPATTVADYVGQPLSPPKSRPIDELVCKLRDALSSDN